MGLNRLGRLSAQFEVRVELGLDEKSREGI
jgi:hypothetical protein